MSRSGNPFDELIGATPEEFQMSPAYIAYSAAGIDARGNHELDQEVAILAKMLEQNAQFPVLSANLYDSEFLASKHYYPAAIGVTKGLRSNLQAH